jgi:hypothetical protein
MRACLAVAVDGQRQTAKSFGSKPQASQPRKCRRMPRPILPPRRTLRSERTSVCPTRARWVLRQHFQMLVVELKGEGEIGNGHVLGENQFRNSFASQFAHDSIVLPSEMDCANTSIPVARLLLRASSCPRLSMCPTRPTPPHEPTSVFQTRASIAADSAILLTRIMLMVTRSV